MKHENKTAVPKNKMKIKFNGFFKKKKQKRSLLKIKKRKKPNRKPTQVGWSKKLKLKNKKITKVKELCKLTP